MHKTGTVVLADSHSPMLEGIRSLLEERFEAVVMVADEPSLLQALEKVRPEIALVDLSFPRIEPNRGNIVGMLRERFPDLKLILLSVHDEPVVAQRMFETGAAGFVLKGSATTDLLPAIEKVLGGGRFVSPAVKSLSGGADRFPVTNLSVNPARSTGPALFAGAWALQQLWLFWVAPILGATLAGVIYPMMADDRTEQSSK